MTRYYTTDTELTEVADSIRETGGTSSPLVWPNGYADAVRSIPSGAKDYNALENHPSIMGNELVGDKTLDQLGITAQNMDVNAESLGITAESLGITPEDIGVGVASSYDVYMLFH